MFPFKCLKKCFSLCDRSHKRGKYCTPLDCPLENNHSSSTVWKCFIQSPLAEGAPSRGPPWGLVLQRLPLCQPGWWQVRHSSWYPCLHVPVTIVTTFLYPQRWFMNYGKTGVTAFFFEICFKEALKVWKCFEMCFKKCLKGALIKVLQRCGQPFWGEENNLGCRK